jgi:hypothetical protein
MKQRILKLLAVVTFVGAATSPAVAAPRTLANGAPAPGNTVAKLVDYSEETLPRIMTLLRSAQKELTAALREEQVAATALQSEPRVLANGSPACGNAESNAAACTVERSDALWKARLQRLLQAGVAVRANQTRMARLREQYAKLGGTDPVLLPARRADPIASTR